MDEAADRAAENDVDVVLLDIRMGEGLGDGLTLLDRLPSGSRPAVALLTGSVDLAHFEQPVGIDAIIGKPFSLDELAAVVRDLAAR